MAPSKQAETTQRRELGNLIKAARTAAGMSQDDLSDACRYAQAHISKMERGLRVSEYVLEAILSVLDVEPTTAELMRTLNIVNSKGARSRRRHVATPRWFTPILDAELDATTIHAWTGERLKGLLQSEAYMIEQFTAHGRTTALDDAVFERRERADIFPANPERHYEFITSESAVERLLLSKTTDPLVAVDQIKHLIQLPAKHRCVIIRIVPFMNALYVPPDFTILGFKDDNLNFGHTETVYGVVKKDAKTTEYKEFTDNWRIVNDAALNATASMELLHQALRRASSP
ncbi:Scr1 family TA system antitoxin-like transcriptional regulator [Amycolatopsis sp. NPDC051102]|uniref:Scr1 family TA system antitoxin-like transcriptional regulator n=1 Tax=Amycolatopsis sp. NPDC051102 TaxID=3155163 RepID=UPI00341A0ED5